MKQEHTRRHKKTKYPTKAECLKILNETGCPDKVLEHILVVADLAMKIANRFPNADRDLILAGSMLHDLGRSRTHGINHAVEGGQIARELKLPKELIRIIERHICAGIEKDNAVSLGLPAKDYVPKTLEERIVAHADNLVEGKLRCNITRSVQILLGQGLPEVANKVKKLHEELSTEAGIDLDEI